MTTSVVQPTKMNCKNSDEVLFALKLKKSFVIDPEMSELSIRRSYSLSHTHSKLTHTEHRVGSDDND